MFKKKHFYFKNGSKIQYLLLTGTKLPLNLENYERKNKKIDTVWKSILNLMEQACFKIATFAYCANTT